MYWCCVCLFRSSSRWNFILQRHIFIPLSLSLLLPIFYDFLQGIRIDPGPRLHKSLATKNKSYFSISSKLLWYSSHQPSCSKLDILDQNWTSSTISWTVSEPCTPRNASQFQHWSSSFHLPLCLSTSQYYSRLAHSSPGDHCWRVFAVSASNG